MIKIVAALVALLGLFAEGKVKSLPGSLKKAVAEALKVPAGAVSVDVSVGPRRVRRIALETDGGKAPVEFLERLRPTGRRPAFPVKVDKFIWRASGLTWEKVRIAKLTVRLEGMELDGAKLARGELAVGRVGDGRVEVLLAPGDVVRALVQAGAPVARVEFSEGSLSVWLGPKGLAMLFVKVKPRVEGGRIGFRVVEAKAGIVPIPRKVAQAALERALAKFLGALSSFGELREPRVWVGPEGLGISGRVGAGSR